LVAGLGVLTERRSAMEKSEYALKIATLIIDKLDYQSGVDIHNDLWTLAIIKNYIKEKHRIEV